MRGLTALDYECLRVLSGEIENCESPPIPQAFAIMRRLIREGRLLLSEGPTGGRVTPKGFAAMRIHEALKVLV
jgi:hypothetical protein